MIRALTGDDRASVLDLLRATDVFTAVELAVAEELIDIVISKPAQTDYFASVAWDDRAVPHCAGMFILGPTPATSGTWHLYWIAVHPSYHGKGVAADLEQSAATFVRERGGYWLLAETSSLPGFERARAFYRRRGYLELARIADYYKPADDLVMYGKRL
jgi:ribosomal protein S18 acetylase RimI-like enzyme